MERLHGMFAFAIWDSRRRVLFLARDRIGVKPLYYAQPAARICSSAPRSRPSSSIPAAPRDLDEEALASYLTFGFTPPPRTMFRGISKLGAGESMTVTARRARRERRTLVGPDAVGRASRTRWPR